MIQASVDSKVRSNQGLNHIIKKLILASLDQTGSTFTIAKPRGLTFIVLIADNGGSTSYTLCVPYPL